MIDLRLCWSDLHWRYFFLHECSLWKSGLMLLKLSQIVSSGVPVSSRVWSRGTEILRERRDLEKVAWTCYALYTFSLSLTWIRRLRWRRRGRCRRPPCCSSTRKPQVVHMIFRFFRTCPRYLGRRLHQPLLQGRGEPVRADRRREQVRPAQHEGQPAQGDQDELSFKCIFFLTRSWSGTWWSWWRWTRRTRRWRGRANRCRLDLVLRLESSLFRWCDNVDDDKQDQVRPSLALGVITLQVKWTSDKTDL